MAHKKDSVFIVHGRDFKPVRELKKMLEEFGLNPIVLHEQASGSLTVAEKLEKYSKDARYAFVILTPDDLGCFRTEIESKSVTTRENYLTLSVAQRLAKKYIRKVSETLRPRARQNVILEFGYFMGLLGRDRVCCLHKGSVDIPSDMHGIVYIPFKESVNENREKIINELIEAGFKLKFEPEQLVISFIKLKVGIQNELEKLRKIHKLHWLWDVMTELPRMLEEANLLSSQLRNLIDVFYMSYVKVVKEGVVCSKNEAERTLTQGKKALLALKELRKTSLHSRSS